MTIAIALQQAVVAHLSADPGLSALTGVHDGPPARAAFPYAAIGDGLVTDLKADTGQMAGAGSGVMTFIAVRAVSFHHVDVFLKSAVGGVRMNWALELGGIFLIGLAAVREAAARGK